MTLGADTYLKVFLRDDSYIICVPEDEPRIDAALTRFLESAGTNDFLITLTMLDGDSYKMPISGIASTLLSTPQGRQNRVLIDKANEDEHRSHRTAAGLGWEDD